MVSNRQRTNRFPNIQDGCPGKLLLFNNLILSLIICVTAGGLATAVTAAMITTTEKRNVTKTRNGISAITARLKRIPIEAKKTGARNPVVTHESHIERDATFTFVTNVIEFP